VLRLVSNCPRLAFESAAVAIFIEAFMDAEPKLLALSDVE
jgi:hypothetical protein